MTMNHPAPVHSIRYGNVEASIYVEENPFGVSFNTTFCKVTEQGKRNRTIFIGEQDLPDLTKVAADVHAWIFKHRGSAIMLEEEYSALSFPKAEITECVFLNASMGRFLYPFGSVDAP
jgi:hypothetical protein